MSMVHASQGTLTPASEQLRSEPAIIAGMARALLPHSKVDWAWLVEDYDRIRDGIEAVFPIFRDYNQRIRTPGGFRLPVGASVRDWGGPGKKAQFLVVEGLAEDAPVAQPGLLTLTTLRAHDQYNTTLYGLSDRYRGVHGRRDVVFLNAEDLAMLGLEQGDLIDVASRLPGATGEDHTVRGFTAVAYDIPRGCAAMYYPEGNCLVPLESYDRQSGTPTYKSVPVKVSAAA